VLNHEQQYSIWPVKKSIPLGWENAGKEGPEGGLSGLYQGSVDRYKIATLEKHREKQLQGIATRLGLMKSIFIRSWRTLIEAGKFLSYAD